MAQSRETLRSWLGDLAQSRETLRSWRRETLRSWRLCAAGLVGSKSGSKSGDFAQRWDLAVVDLVGSKSGDFAQLETLRSWLAQSRETLRSWRLCAAGYFVSSLRYVLNLRSYFDFYV